MMDNSFIINNAKELITIITFTTIGIVCFFVFIFIAYFEFKDFKRCL